MAEREENVSDNEHYLWGTPGETNEAIGKESNHCEDEASTGLTGQV